MCTHGVASRVGGRHLTVQHLIPEAWVVDSVACDIEPACGRMPDQFRRPDIGVPRGDDLEEMHQLVHKRRVNSRLGLGGVDLYQPMSGRREL